MNVVVGIVAVFLIGVVAALLVGWPVMLLWGAIAGTYGFPSMGYGTAIQVSLLSAILFKGGSYSSN